MTAGVCDSRVSELERALELGRSLFRISTALVASADFEESVRSVLAEAASACCSSGSGIALRREGSWLVSHVHDLPRPLVGRSIPDAEFQGATTSLATGKASVTASSFPGGPAGTLLTLPLIVRGRTTGCLFFRYSPEAGRIEDFVPDYAEKAAVLVSLAFENRRLDRERERLEQLAEEDRARFNALLEEMPAGVIIAEAPSGRLVRANEQVERIWRKPLPKAAEAGEYGAYEGFHADGKPYAPEEWPLIRSIRNGEMVTGEEIRIARGDGTEAFIAVSSAPIRDIRGRTIAGIAVFTDVSDRRQAGEALRESESRFRNIASAAQDAVILIDSNGTVEFWNKSATKIFGYTSEEMMGKHLHSYIMPERYRQEHIRGFEAFRTSGQGRFIGRTYEIAAKKKDGTEFPVELSLAAVRVKDGWSAIGIVRDITARKRSEEELKRTLEELERSNREFQQFAYIVSHDLQEPLRMVSSYVQLLAKRYGDRLDEKAERYISFAADGAARMSILIEDLLAYSRVGTKGKEFAAVDMEAIVKDAVANLKVAIEESGAAVDFDFPEPPRLTGDPVQLTQLMQNLIANAVKFSGKKGDPRVRVTAERRGSEWIFGVHDNGIGIEPRHHERIFQIFQRLHTREEYRGTGVGLAICKKIVERHGGAIRVESTPGEGASFYVTLPEAPRFAPSPESGRPGGHDAA